MAQDIQSKMGNKETPTLTLEKNVAVMAKKNTQERSVLLEMCSATTVSVKVTTVQCAITEMFKLWKRKRKTVTPSFWTHLISKQ